MQIISRKEAKEQGLKRYFTGKPCKHGHVSERYTYYSGKCLECLRITHDIWSKQIEQDRKNEMIRSERRNRRLAQRQSIIDRGLEAEKMEQRKVKHMAAFARGSLIRILNNWKGGRKKMEEAHGYTYDDLRQHLESQFVDGMSWGNRSEWHIDHIKPVKAFLDEGITDPAIINALDNLQPLWAKDNLRKGAKWDG